MRELPRPRCSQPGHADSFFLAVTQGLDPNGSSLKVFTPRWELTRAQSDSLIEYLKAR